MAKIFVGMSGGVDSSVTAALLMEQGHEVVGVYMKNWTQDLPGMKCPWAQDLADAKRVAVKLGIDFEVFDFEKEYREKVVGYMLAEYQAGRTPNPDIMCNQEVKFKLFLEVALDKGADFIATGHYANVSHHKKRGTLQCAVDENKDQTYFLYRVSGEALAKTFFPLGGLTKPEVRKMAEARGLLTAHKKDSQGICFVGSVGIKDFLGEFIEAAPGNIIEKESGTVLGTHDGAIFYTIGQRHGLDVGGGLPYYVVGKNMQKNEIIVSQNLNSDALWTKKVAIQGVHFINQPIEEGDEILVRTRHRGELLKAYFLGGVIEFFDEQKAVAVGQSLVFYREKECLGGAIAA